jgi:hypothetical protein
MNRSYLADGIAARTLPADGEGRPVHPPDSDRPSSKRRTLAGARKR